MSLTIIPLNQKPELADVCAAWDYAQWGCFSTRSLAEITEHYRSSSRNPTVSTPFTWIALSDDRPAGMVSLEDSDHPDHPEIPLWFASLFVHEEFRGRGISHHLIETFERETFDSFGACSIHLFTAHTEGLYERHGFEHVKKVRSHNGLHPDGNFLMKKDLACSKKS